MSHTVTGFFQHPRYQINKFLLRFNGQWPYQKMSIRVILLVSTFLVSFTIMIAQVRKLIVELRGDDLVLVIATTGPIIVHLGCVIKVVNSIINSGRMRQLLERIYDDWHMPMGSEETILARFSDDGRLFTITYTVCLYSAMVVFLAVSTLPRIMVIHGWMNITSPTLFPIPVDYWVEGEDYYIYIQLHVCAGIFLVITILIAVDVMFVVFVQHACGLFSVVGYRLEHLVETADLNIDLRPSLSADKNFWIATDCIRKHNDALAFVDLLDSAYSWSFLLLMGLNMLSISFTGIQVIWGASPDSLDEAIRQGVFGASQVLHLFFESLFSQRLTDHSVEVFDAITRSKWYMTSLRTRKLLNFMLMRSMTPWELKAGKMFTMSMESFSAVVRTSMSYLTLLSSME